MSIFNPVHVEISSSEPMVTSPDTAVLSVAVMHAAVEPRAVVLGGTVSEVAQIGYWEGQFIARPEDVERFVEEPLVRPATDLWNLGIRTVSSSANVLGGKVNQAYVVVDASTLTPTNRQRLESGIPPTTATKLTVESIDADGSAVMISMPISPTTSVGDITNEFGTLSSVFVPQPPLWDQRYTLDQLKEVYGMAPDENVEPTQFASDTGYHYDRASGVFFLSAELAEMSRRQID